MAEQTKPQVKQANQTSQEPQAKPQMPVQRPAAKKRKLRTKFPTTQIVHVLDGRVFTGQGVELEAADSFLQAQIDAGKMEWVEE